MPDMTVEDRDLLRLDALYEHAQEDASWNDPENDDVDE